MNTYNAYYTMSPEPEKLEIAHLKADKAQLIAGLKTCLRALTDETGNEAEREYDAAITARNLIAKHSSHTK